MSNLRSRRALELVQEYLDAFRVVVVEGPRQAGKTTLLRLLEAEGALRLVTFDDATELAAARDDPPGYLSTRDRTLAIDEFQRAGDPLLLAVKYLVDRDNTRGQFVLAGSTNFLTTRQLSDSLAGRVGIVRVWPFTQGEIRGVRESFLDAVLDDPSNVVGFRAERLSRATLAELIVTGGYPESVDARSARARQAFFDAYLATVVSREAVLDAGERRTSSILRSTFEAVATRTAGEFDIAGVARDTGSARDTVDAHVSVLETLHQVMLLPAWAPTEATRAKRRRKVIVTDSGVASALLRHDADALVDPTSRAFGQLLETFAIAEIVRQSVWSNRCTLSHYRDRDGREIDLVVEGPGRSVTGIEIKASATPTPAAARHLRYLAERSGDRWRGGIVLYPGELAFRLGDRLWAVPLAALWA